MSKNISFKPGKLQLKPGAIPTIFKRKPDPGRQQTHPTPRAAFGKDFAKRSRRRPGCVAMIMDLIIHKLKFKIVWIPNMFASSQHPCMPGSNPISSEQTSLSCSTSTEDVEAELQPKIYQKHTMYFIPFSTVTPSTVPGSNPRSEQTSKSCGTSTEDVKTYHKRNQTPAKWTSKIHVRTRPYATQTASFMVQTATQYDPPAPFAFPREEDHLDTSFWSEGSMEMEDDPVDLDYDPQFDMDGSDNERYVFESETHIYSDILPKTRNDCNPYGCSLSRGPRFHEGLSDNPVEKYSNLCLMFENDNAPGATINRSTVVMFGITSNILHYLRIAIRKEVSGRNALCPLQLRP
ncbi:hypothetical protein GQR58_002495 [Nymphon striatum]|nr:hypothetical protein GQR58_002495 [Nymphon striatum]